MVVKNNRKHKCKDISDDLLYLSIQLDQKSNEKNMNLHDEYEMLKEIIKKMEKLVK